MAGMGWRCKTCAATFDNVDDFVLHLKNVEKKKFITQCEICTEVFIDKQTYKYHLQSAHEIEMNCPKCKICGASFKTKYFVDRHMSVHSTDKGYSCSKCGKKFTQSFNKIKHERVCVKKENLIMVFRKQKLS